MNEVERMIMQRLGYNAYIDITVEAKEYADEDEELIRFHAARGEDWSDKVAALHCYQLCFPLCDSDEDDGYYKFLAERYLVKYWSKGGEFHRIGDRYVMDMPARDGDEVYYFIVANRDRLPKGAQRKQKYITPMRWLARTLGSIREGDDGPYFDDSYEARCTWAFEQTKQAYRSGFDDPLERAEDGWIWRALFDRSFELVETEDEAVGFTFSLRMLRWKYELKFVATDSGLVMRGKNGGGLKYQKLMEATGRGSWMKSQVDEIRRRRDEARGVGATAWAEENVAGIERPIAAAFRTSDADDGTAGRAAALFSIALQGGGQCSET